MEHSGKGSILIISYEIRKVLSVLLNMFGRILRQLVCTIGSGDGESMRKVARVCPPQRTARALSAVEIAARAPCGDTRATN